MVRYYISTADLMKKDEFKNKDKLNIDNLINKLSNHLKNKDFSEIEEEQNASYFEYPSTSWNYNLDGNIIYIAFHNKDYVLSIEVPSNSNKNKVNSIIRGIMSELNIEKVCGDSTSSTYTKEFFLDK